MHNSELGANTIRLWGWDIDGDHTEFLDMAYNGGNQPIYVIATIWMEPKLYNIKTQDRLAKKTFLLSSTGLRFH